MMSDQTILVTGAAGFIGFHIARRLLAEGRNVVGLDNLNNYYDPALKAARLNILKGESGFSFERIDLADRAADKAAVRHAPVCQSGPSRGPGRRTLFD